MKDILGMPVVENALLPKGTAFLIVQEKGVVTQMVKVYDEMQRMPTASLLAELHRRRPDCKKCPTIPNINGDYSCQECIWRTDGLGKDNFKPSK
jgi:hypothetical protein